MRNLSVQETLLTALPILLVLLALIGALIFIPPGSVFDIRGRAAYPTPTATTQPTITTIPTPARPREIGCSDLYQPVCSLTTNRTYINDCEANLANALPARPGECNL